jgi:hypothetical protein
MNHIALLHEEHADETVIKHLTPIAASFALRTQPAVIVASVLVGSLVSRTDTFSAGTVLEEVNGIKVKNLQEFREAIVKPVKRESGYFLTLLSRSHEFVVLPLEESFREEFELSEMHMFNVSPLVLSALATTPQMMEFVTHGDKLLKQKIQRAIKRAAREAQEEDL